MDIATKIKSTSFLDKVIGKTNFGPNTAVVIVKFKTAAHAKIMTQCYHYCYYWVH